MLILYQTMAKHTKNPFKMYGSYIGLLIPLILGIISSGPCVLNFSCNNSLGMFNIGPLESVFMYGLMIIGFFAGWLIQVLYNKTNKTMKWIILSVVILLLVVPIGAVIIGKVNSTDRAVSISGYYDKNGELIKTEQAVIGGVEGVYSIKIKVTALNNDGLPLTFSIISSTPSPLSTALASVTAKTAQPDASVEWESGLVGIAEWVGQSPVFCVTVKATGAGRQAVEKESCSAPVEILEDPDAGFEVTVEPNPIPGDNSPVQDPLPVINDTIPPPSLTFQTNAIPGAYTEYKSGTWVRVDTNTDGTLEQYAYASTITAGDCIGTQLTTTPEGYNVKWRTGSTGISVHVCNPTGVGYRRYG